MTTEHTAKSEATAGAGKAHHGSAHPHISAPEILRALVGGSNKVSDIIFSPAPRLAEITELKNGIVLVTGPTGSGKSSTLAAIINKINEDAFNCTTSSKQPVQNAQRLRACLKQTANLHHISEFSEKVPGESGAQRAVPLELFLEHGKCFLWSVHVMNQA